jgi:hypothetical protein
MRADRQGGHVQKDVVVSVPKNDRSFAEALEGDKRLEATKLTGAGMDGGSEYFVYLVPIATYTVKTLVELIKARWEKAKNVKFEVDGMTITGASLDEISEFLERNLPERHHQ